MLILRKGLFLFAFAITMLIPTLQNVIRKKHNGFNICHIQIAWMGYSFMLSFAARDLGKEHRALVLKTLALLEEEEDD